MERKSPRRVPLCELSEVLVEVTILAVLLREVEMEEVTDADELLSKVGGGGLQFARKSRMRKETRSFLKFLARDG